MCHFLLCCVLYVHTQLQRPSQDVETFLTQAKLDRKDLKHIVQPLSFSNAQDSELLLMEVDEDILKDLKNGDVLTFRGRDDDTAVLCTNKCTFEVREAETSNSLLLVPDLILPAEMGSVDDNSLTESPKQVPNIFHTYLELRQCSSRLRLLRDLLQRKPFKGTELEDDDTTDQYTLNDLFNVVQARESEILSTLDELPVVQLNGFCRLLDVDYHFRVINFITNYIEAESIPMDKVPMGEAVTNVAELEPSEIVREVFKHCTTPCPDEGFYSLNRDYICRLTAQAILKNVDRFNLSEFVELWQKSVPEGIHVNVEQLEGLAIVDHMSIPESIYLLDKWDLPQEASERFAALFRQKEKWTMSEIRPYIEDLCTGVKGDVNTLLMKHARAFMENGVRKYAAKHSAK
ncbi:sister chromatid cohesion protein DCC1-like isoform X2 [Ornithodoros turicata]|uniref:sister chromatid cohesion protein DCC1-like isoform X2 n=1 Tax=Ornithodoros turicata TaxID=34597 RepID=UPI00313A3671